MVLPGEVGATNILQTMRFIATRETAGAIILMPTKKASRVTDTIGCLHHVSGTYICIMVSNSDCFTTIYDMQPGFMFHLDML